MTRTISLPLSEDQVNRLNELARSLHRSVDETIPLLVEEALRMREHPAITFRTSSVGRQAYVQGSSLAVWEVMMIANDYQGDVTMTAEYLDWPVAQVEAALRYAAAFPEEISAALKENESFDAEVEAQLLPKAKVVYSDH